jgi:transposase-like protein
MKSKKRAKFTYVGRRTKFITTLFENFDLKIPFKVDNTIGNLLTHNKNTNFKKCNKCGVNQLTCQDCNKKYNEKTGTRIHTRFQEHFRDFNTKMENKKFAHLIDNGHSIAPMKNIMEILHVIKKGNQMKTLEKCHI